MAEAAEKVVQNEEVTPKGPEDEGSLAQIMEQMERPTFTGHPALGGAEIPEGETPGAEEVKAKGEEEVKPKPEEEKPKYATWEEEKKGRLEAERTMHEATTARAQAEEKLASIEAENARIKAELEEARKPPVQEEKPLEAPQPITKEERKTRYKTALRQANTAIARIDRTLPQEEVQEQISDAWADALAEAGLGESAGVPLNVTEIQKIARETYKAEREAEEARTKEKREKDVADERIRTWNDALAMGTDSGLDLSKEDTADYILFYNFSRRVPDEFLDKPLKDQVKWVVGQVQERLGKVTQTNKEEEAAARKTQEEQEVLARGGNRPASQVKEEAFSLRGIMEKTQESRRI